jgi:hypothetical protein
MRRILAVITVGLLASSVCWAAPAQKSIRTTFASGATCQMKVAGSTPVSAVVERPDGVVLNYDFAKKTVSKLQKDASGKLTQVDKPTKMKKVVYVVRGPVGSSKDSLAERLVKKNEASIITTDKFWIGADGQYKFDRAKLGESHTWAQGQAASAMTSGLSPIAVCNTTCRASEARPYVENALENGYRIEIRQPKNKTWSATKLAKSKANKFGIPAEIIQKQITAYEPSINLASVLSVPTFGAPRLPTPDFGTAKPAPAKPLAKGARVQLRDGVEGTVFWMGASKFGNGTRLGVKDAAGNVHWADANKVKQL